MFYEKVFSEQEVESFLITLGITCSVAISVMATRYFNLCSSSVSRKLLHISMAPVFLLCWPLFPNSANAKYLAMIIPLLFTIAFWTIGKGIVKSDIIVKSMSRSGQSSELAIGPVHYGLIMTLTTLLFWKQSSAVYAIMIISFGDGFAAIIGSIQKGNKSLWWNPQKSWYGLIAFIVFSMVGIWCVFWYYEKFHYRLSDSQFMRNAFFVSILCAFSESMTIPNYDNISLFVVSILAYHTVLHMLLVCWYNLHSCI